MAAGRAIEPVFAITALWIGQTLLLTALWALPVHFVVIDVVVEQQAAFRADPRLAIENDGFAVLLRADENRAATAAVVLTFLLFFANGTFFHESIPVKVDVCLILHKKTGPLKARFEKSIYFKSFDFLKHRGLDAADGAGTVRFSFDGVATDRTDIIVNFLVAAEVL